MKRSMDLVRTLMLLVEDEGTPELRNVPEIDGFDQITTIYHVRLLIEAQYMQAIDASDLSSEDYMQLGLTWSGHEFLETIRDSEVWSKTKAGATKVGSWSVGLLAELGKAYAREKARQLGLPV